MAAGLVQSAEASGGKGGSLGVALSAAPSAGNVLVAGIATDNTTISAITNGLTLETSQAYGAGSGNAYLYSKVCDGTESATTTFTLAAGDAAWGFLAEFSGVGASSANARASGSGTNPDTGSFGAASDILFVGFFGHGGTTITFTAGTGTIIDQGNGGPSYAATWDAKPGPNKQSVVASASAGWAALGVAFPSGLSIPVLQHAHRRRRA